MFNIELNEIELAVLILFAIINIVAFFIMLSDKIKSVNSETERISEGMMFFLAAFFGALGVYAGMFTFRHKTRKWYFLVGIPILIVQNFAFIYLIYLILGKNNYNLGL